MTSLAPRVVVVHRATERDRLLARHGSYAQAAFFLRERGRDPADIDRSHQAVERALAAISAAIPADWRRGRIERADLDRFLFAPGDIVVVAGQDGLVANVAKYLDGQPVIGVDPEPGRNPGVLVRHRAEALAPLLRAAAAERAPVQRRTMVRVRTDDGLELRALNEVFIGHPTHQTARYRLESADGEAERQASSGVLVSTGTGATGWCGSVWRQSRSTVRLPEPDEAALAWFVREAWASPSTGTDRTEGRLAGGAALRLVAESDGLVVFGDGIEADRLTLAWGQAAQVSVDGRRLELVA
ncbi:NAD(+)/NADH kinase [Allonocardiopsis opalescens]|uniref:ATP-NAD kinase n=1 Tax=Allonocardiopsis opalescens TaxID=1144618 RepID=A0A2T0PZP9_9ACTN|nr:NAD(+)/NADH kinase [Allonocardiopsis opalescens]PRX96996.1 ATP-NAD kinase [Allonocardiopsis opalescens]